MAKNILEVIDGISNDAVFSPSQNLKQISRLARGFAPMLTEILQDYIQQNEADIIYRAARIKAAKKMLGV